MSRWRPIIEGIDATALDCIQANIAVLADSVHSSGTYRLLGAPLRFHTTASPVTSLPTVEPSIGQHASDARVLAGIRLRNISQPSSVSGAFCLLDAPTSPQHALYVVADAYALPWCPYAGHAHMAHSFLLLRRDEESVEVVDAYHNDTPYGPARPSVWVISRGEFEERLAGQSLRVGEVEATTPQRPGIAHTLQRNASSLSEARHLMRVYAQTYRDYDDPSTAAEALLLESWLLARSRRLHAQWLTHTVPREVCEPFIHHADAWARFAGQCYLAVRRLRRGNTPPEGLHEVLLSLLYEDVDQAQRLSETSSASTTAV